MPHFIIALIAIVGLVALELDRRRRPRGSHKHHLPAITVTPMAKKLIQDLARKRRASEKFVHVRRRAKTGRVAVIEVANGNS